MYPERVTRSRLLPVLAAGALATLAACGGGNGGPPTTPAPNPNPGPSINACSAVGQGVNATTAIVNGTECSAANTPVVLLRLIRRDGFRDSAGCSGTIIGPRTILTAAHCLDGDIGFVEVWLGSGNFIPAASFKFHPGYNSGNTTFLDVGVVLVSEDLGRAPVPVLLNRDAVVGETAIVAGWGRNQNGETGTFRAGATTISGVESTVLRTLFSQNSASICAGDSGGPILLSEGGVWTVAGINSASSIVTCNDGTNFYANVRHSQIRSFIEENAGSFARR